MIQAALDGGAILIAGGLADLFAVRRIPGGVYNSLKRSWQWPATPRAAARLLKEFPELRANAALVSLSTLVQEALQAPALPVISEAPARSEILSEAAVTSPVEPVVAVQQLVPALQPTGIRTQPWRHQLLALAFAGMAFEIHSGAALLAMKMGTGKTLVALMIIVRFGCKRILIICPRRVIAVWASQIPLHIEQPGIVTALDSSEGTVAERAKKADLELRIATGHGIPFFALINYEAAIRPDFQRWALARQWDMVVVDESHRAKAPGGRASLLLKALRKRSKQRLMLTGTPMPHSPLDIFAQARFLDPAIFGEAFVPFRLRYAVMGGYKDKEVVRFQHLEELKQKLHTLCFRVDAEDVLDLPASVEVDYEVELGSVAARAYEQLEHDLITEIDSGMVTAANAMVKLLRLQQVTGGALRADSSQSYQRIDTGKIDLLADILSDLGPDEPWVCFCRFHSDLDAVHQAAAVAGVGFERDDYMALELSGRRDELARWQAGEGMGLAVQTAAGGVGVDLTRAAYSIFYSLSFSLAEYLQAMARTVRPPQRRNVTHIHLVAKDTIDRRVRRALARREQVIESVLNELQGLKETQRG